MELPSKNLEQLAFTTRSEIEEQILIVMDKFTHEEHLSQPLQTLLESLSLLLPSLSGYFDIFNFKNKKIKIYFTRSINDDDFTKNSLPIGSSEIENLYDETQLINIEPQYSTRIIYPFKNRAKFSMLGKIKETSSNITVSQIAFTRDE